MVDNHYFLNYLINVQEKDHLFLLQSLNQYLMNFYLNNKIFPLSFEEFKPNVKNLLNLYEFNLVSLLNSFNRIHFLNLIYMDLKTLFKVHQIHF